MRWGRIPSVESIRFSVVVCLCVRSTCKGAYKSATARPRSDLALAEQRLVLIGSGGRGGAEAQDGGQQDQDPVPEQDGQQPAALEKGEW